MLHDARFLPPDSAVREVALALLAGWLAAVETHLTPIVRAVVPGSAPGTAPEGGTRGVGGDA
jgi:glutathione S-transferase